MVIFLWNPLSEMLQLLCGVTLCIRGLRGLEGLYDILAGVIRAIFDLSG